MVIRSRLVVAEHRPERALLFHVLRVPIKAVFLAGRADQLLRVLEYSVTVAVGKRVLFLRVVVSECGPDDPQDCFISNRSPVFNN